MRPFSLGTAIAFPIAMRYHALATDYDGTLAHHGVVDRETLAACERLAASGRRLILVTGRELNELLGVFPEIGIFHLVVTENGGLLYWPESREVELLCKPPQPEFIALLRGRGVDPLAVGRTIVATVEPNETIVLSGIRDLGLELHVIFNKGAVMVLPTGVNKATGLAVALERMGLSPHNVVAIGDAENDHSMLQFAEIGAATANAVPMLKEHADVVLARGHGAGVAELIDAMVADDLRSRPPRRRAVLLGRTADGTPCVLPAAAASLLIAGESGSGKSSLATGMLERLAEQGYQCCVIDPEGDYEALPGAVVLGGAAGPTPQEFATALDKPHGSVVASLVSLPVADRPTAFAPLWARLAELRARVGRPQCLLLDEAHHLLPRESDTEPFAQIDPAGLVCVTVHPESVSPVVLRTFDWVAATGPRAVETLQAFAHAAGAPPPATEGVPAPSAGNALLWCVRDASPPVEFAIEPPAAAQRRHRRKYAEGTLPPERSFYFRGPEGKLNLRAQNLMLFLQIGDGVDEETWHFHLRRGDYSEWLLNSVKDRDLAQAVRAIEKDRHLDGASARARLREAIEARYTAPAESAA
jgi:hydroxymethylpyrimidine pyrophosphatase-like HAD family hydrolase